MIRSMTGYGRGENSAYDRKFIVEMKSVNHRYNDITIKLPRSMNYLEEQIRKQLMQEVFRGKTDVYISFETFSTDDVCVKINESLAKAYVEKLRELEGRFALSSNDTLNIVSKFPEIITVEKQQKEESVIWETLLPALEGAIEKFVAMRTTEGMALKEDILKKAEGIKALVAEVKERSPLVILDYKEKLQNRLKELLNGVDVD